MRVEKLQEKYLEGFKDYCKTYGAVHDDSFLYEEDIIKLSVSDDNPTFLLLEEERVIGVLSLLLDEYYLRDSKSRLLIYHCVQTEPKHYKALMEFVLMDSAVAKRNDVRKLEMFIPDELTDTTDILNTIGFEYYRTSFVMIRKNEEKVRTDWSEGYQLKPFIKGEDEEVYANVRNIAFKNLAGSAVPMTKDMVIKQSEDNYLLEDGMQVLWYQEHKPVGVVRVMSEIDETGNYSFIAPIAIVPEYQGKGLGRELLKAGIEIGQKNGYDDCMLVVNAENEQALSLYKKTAFKVDLAVSCYRYMI